VAELARLALAVAFFIVEPHSVAIPTSSTVSAFGLSIALAELAWRAVEAV
jgi:hypothetical protein